MLLLSKTSIVYSDYCWYFQSCHFALTDLIQGTALHVFAESLYSPLICDSFSVSLFFFNLISLRSTGPVFCWKSFNICLLIFWSQLYRMYKFWERISNLCITSYQIIHFTNKTCHWGMLTSITYSRDFCQVLQCSANFSPFILCTPERSH